MTAQPVKLVTMEKPMCICLQMHHLQTEQCSLECYTITDSAATLYQLQEQRGIPHCPGTFIGFCTLC